MKLFEIAREDLVVGFCNSDVTFRLHNTVSFLNENVCWPLEKNAIYGTLFFQDMIPGHWIIGAQLFKEK